MGDWVVESSSFIEQLMSNKIVMLNQSGVNEVVKIIEEKDKEIERLNNTINELEEELERESNMKEEDTCLEHNTFIDIRNTLKTVLKRLQELKGADKE